MRDPQQNVLAVNELGRAFYSPLIGEGGRTPNLARFQFLDPASRDFYPECDLMARMCGAGQRDADLHRRARIAIGREPQTGRVVGGDAARHAGLKLQRSQSRWKTSVSGAQSSPGAAVSTGCWHGSVRVHQRWVVGSAATAAMSAS